MLGRYRGGRRPFSWRGSRDDTHPNGRQREPSNVNLTTIPDTADQGATVRRASAPRADDFFRTLFSEDVVGLVEMRVIENGSGVVDRAFLSGGPNHAIIKDRKQRFPKGNIYFGVATRRNHKGGDKDHCFQLSALYGDTDFKDTPEDQARKRLAGCPLAPTAVVHSGGGLHSYWLLREPLDMPLEMELAESYLRRLAVYLESDSKVAEVARVLRVPGTFNHKYNPPRPVILETLNVEADYNLTDFDEWLPADPRPKVNGMAGPFTVPDVIPVGERNDTLYKLGRSLKAKQIPPSVIGTTLRTVNAELCKPTPMDDGEVNALIANVVRQPDRPDFTGASESAPDEAPWWLTGSAFEIEADRPAPPMLVDGLVPGEGITLFHADPRTLKTWIAEDVAIALASGMPTLTTLDTSGPVTVLYLSNEDGKRQTADRLRKLARGRGLPGIPDGLLLAIHAGAWLDEESWQAKVITLAKREHVRVVILDPLRSLTAAVDKGPSDLQPFTRFLRLLIQASGCALILVHHDTKPIVGQPDTRKRAYRASGGAVFSIADSPIHAERVGDEPVVVLYPNNWKFSETPGPLEVRLTVTDDAATLTAKPTDSTSAADRAAQIKILNYLAATPDRSGSDITRAIRGRKTDVLVELDRMANAGLVDSRPGPKRSVLWFPVGGRT